MDKTPEINSSPENLQIPENWQFPERGDPGIKVEQIDLNEKFLAYQYDINIQDPNVTHPLYGYEECFFNENGKVVVSRSHEKISTYIGFWGGELPIMYLLSTRAQGPYPSSSLEVHFSSGEAGGSLGDSMYDRDTLRFTALGEYFTAKDLSGVLIKSPKLVFISFQTVTPEEKRTFDLKKDLSGSNFVVKEDESRENEATVFNNREEEIFKVVWGEQEDEREKTAIFVVSQTHIPTGIVKAFSAPLRIDTKKIAEAVFSRTPYPKDERGRLVVPWRNIDRIVGASISYSYSPQTPGK
jgi:hypothetical protein